MHKYFVYIFKATQICFSVFIKYVMQIYYIIVTKKKDIYNYIYSALFVWRVFITSFDLLCISSINLLISALSYKPKLFPY